MHRLRRLQREAELEAQSHPRRAPLVARGYRRLLVPVVDSPSSGRAIDIACRLAADRHSQVIAVAVIEVPPLLPLDAHMFDEELDARRLLERAGATADSYGVTLVPRTVRVREAADGIVEQATKEDVELIVLGVTQTSVTGYGAARFGATAKHVLESARCRVMLVAAEPADARTLESVS